MNRCRWLLGFGLELAPAISVPVGFGSRKGRALSVQEMGPTWIFPNTNGLFPRVTEWCFCPPPWYLSNMGLIGRPFATAPVGAKLYVLKSWKNTWTSPIQALGNWSDMSEVGAGQCEGICEYASFNDCRLNSNCCINFENGTQYMFHLKMHVRILLSLWWKRYREKRGCGWLLFKSVVTTTKWKRSAAETHIVCYFQTHKQPAWSA